MESSCLSVAQSPPESLAPTVLAVITQLAQELHPQAQPPTVTLDTVLDRELGFDSLGRMELLRRLEQAFDVQLPAQALATADVPRDLLPVVYRAQAGALPHVQLPNIPPPVSAVTGAPDAAQTWLDVLEWHVRCHPEHPHITLYSDDESSTEVLTYAALAAGAEAVAAGLQAQGLQPGQSVALMLPTGREFFDGFYGILLAGGVPVPLYPPARPSQVEEHLQRQVRILDNAAAALLLTVPAAKPLARMLRAQVATVRQVLTMPEVTATGGAVQRPPVQTHDLALLQYTSGSTGNPKGVMLSHAQLLANVRAMGQGALLTSSDVFVSWLPLYHDMGLIGAWLGSLYFACPLVLMSPLAFLARPARWLWAMHTHRATLSGGPNFAYELCARRIDDAELVGLDLSTWRMAFNGAEPVSAATLERFTARFAPYGFRPETMVPVYGLAEASLGVAFPTLGQAPQIDRIQREPLRRSGRAIPATPDDTTALRFVACGEPLSGYHLRIVDAAGHEVGERQEGRLELQGPSITSGYFRNAEATSRLFHGAWLDSGDLAYMVGQTLYLTGRVKDLIIRAGRNIIPHEVEDVVGDIPGIRRGCVAVFGSTDPASGTERLVVLAETRETETAPLATLHNQVEATVTDLLGTPPDDVVFAPPGTVLKTSSGKLRRAACRERYEQGAIGQRPRAVWWQLTRLALASALPQARRSLRSAVDALYAAYLWTLCGLIIPAAWAVVAVLPQPRWSQAVLRRAVRLVMRLAGLPLQVQGLEHVPRQGPSILVVNHASYLDGPILLAALPMEVTYVVKRELASSFVSRRLLQRIGAAFVERFDVQRSVQDTEHLRQVVEAGRTLVIFPEGTFVRTPGLQAFRMGAFSIAAQTGVPIVPVGLAGTRAILRADQWFPRRGAVRVTISPPLYPQGSDWSAAVALRHAARAPLARACGEMDMVLPTAASDDAPVV